MTTDAPFERLGALDATFLTIEHGGAHMHVGGVLRFGGEPVAYDELVAAIERRLHLVPRYRQRLEFVPFGVSQPVWVDDEAFDVRRHVRHIAVPPPGTDGELATLAARIFSQPLDRDLPLWELWLVDGCRGGGSALISKLHHCLVDGLASVNIATILFDTAPEPPDAGIPPEPWCARPAPARNRVLLDGVTHQLAAAPGLLTGAVRAMREPRAFVARALTATAGLGAFIGSGLRRAPESVYNPPTGGQRRIAWARTDLRQIRAIKEELGGTVNDVALAAVAGALRSHLRRRGERVDRVTLKTMVPVSLREPGEQNDMGNRITTLWAPLPVGVADPRRRLRLVSAAMQRLKRGNQVAGAKAMTALLDSVPPVLTLPVANMLASPRFFNLTVTNVPGPREPLYLLGAAARGDRAHRPARPRSRARHRDAELPRRADVRTARRRRRHAGCRRSARGHPPGARRARVADAPAPSPRDRALALRREEREEAEPRAGRMTSVRPRAARAWKEQCVETGRGHYTLATEDTRDVPVRRFLTPSLLEQVEDDVYSQIVTATRFPGVRLVVITPDVHVGYGVPVGCAILTDAQSGSIALGPVGFDIGCGMVSMRSEVPAEAATAERRQAFNRAVMRRVELGPGGRGDLRFARIDSAEFERIVRGGAEYYTRKYGDRIDRSRAERDVIPVEDAWELPRTRADRGMQQIGSLGGGNHFIELQRSTQSGTLFVQVHTGSRGFGHGLAEHYFQVARAEQPARISHLDEAWFAPGAAGRRDYLNAVAAGGNYAIVNRLVISEALAAAFSEVFGARLELVYEISHNLVQREWHPELGEVWVHRKGATRAFPAGHPQLLGTPWESTGHPVLIPGSNRDRSYILRPADSAVSGFTVNHGAGRRMSRAAARRSLVQSAVDRDYRSAGIVVNVDGRVPIDEAGPAYKDSREVVEAVTRAGLATIEHELWPLASVKADR